MTEMEYKDLCDLAEKAHKDIKKLLKKEDITPEEWKTAGAAIDILKDISTIKAMEEEYGSGGDYSAMRKSYMSDGDIYSRGRRYYNSGDYRNSYHGEPGNAATEKIRNLMNSATSENERMTYQRFLDENERRGW